VTNLVRSIRDRYESTLERMAAAARAVGRPTGDVRLVVVTKSQPLEIVSAVIEAGARELGENYPEEGAMKIQSLRAGSAVEWHMIGHIQSRKAKLVAEHFSCVHSVDSLKLAERLHRFAGEYQRRLPVLLEFNLAAEATKSGWRAEDEAGWSALLPELARLLALEHLDIRGLMAMPPLSDNAEASRPYFQKLRRLQARLQGRLPQSDWRELSMGTSADYAVAVEEGATLVRVGTAIVGSRPAA
jgi:pyridoxal phosphate enzyme (YggS family)